MAAQSLITKERTQKLDLLIHLLSNLPQALVVCGPEGIGKTTLLKVLQERKTESWRYCLMQGNADLSFEAIQGQLSRAPSGKSGQTSGRYEIQHKQIVLIIDNAGELVPGLIATIIQYAAANPVLRVIFALTHDELQVKRGSDRAIDDCHIVEIPPLSEKQCGDFLQHLSTKPSLNLSFKAISENMIAHIYRETHGVPGRIIAEISGSSAIKQGGKLKWTLILSIATALAIAFGVQWLVSSKYRYAAPASPKAPTSAEHNANNIDTTSPQPESQITLALPPAQPIIQPQEQAAPTNKGNGAKDAPEPSTEVNISKDDQQQIVTPTAKPEAIGTAVIKQSAIDAKQAESSEAISHIEPPIPENSEIKNQAKQISAVEIAQKPSKKSPDTAPQNMAERLWASREKQKQAELSKALDRVEPSTPNNPELIQIPQKPVEIEAIPEEPDMKTVAPQQIEPDQSSTQSLNNFTLQLMVLSKQSSINDILRKYPAMAPDFRVINTIANGQQKFILEYGSYPDATSANKARQSLPFEFRKALVRKHR
ncbi:MAG: hypothetical protein EPN17_05875 [Methylobacter sp.]|nr:MAG: hypothetical protein EPN17_05875 [Methylobacter sp.]